MRRRLLATFLHDVRLQWRNGFYAASAVLALFMILLLDSLPAVAVGRLLPVVIVNNLIVNGFYFVSGLVLLEKAEGTLKMQVVTPLRSGEYLACKGASLVLLSLLENVAIVLVVTRGDVQLLWLGAGVTLGTLFFMLSGFTAVSRYEGIGEFLLPSFLIVTLLALPLLSYFGVGDVPVLRLLALVHPLHPVLALLQRALQETSGTGQALLYLLAAAMWIVPAFVLARRAFERFVRAEIGLRGSAAGRT